MKKIKRTYNSPKIEKIKVDTEIALVMASTNNLPTEPGGQPTFGYLIKASRILQG
jgi:hypothetical protein